MADTAKWAEFQFTSAAAATIASRPVGCEPGQQNERFADPPCLEARPISPQDGPSRETLKVAMASTKPSDPDRCNGMHPVARLKSMRKCATATAAAAGTKADVSTISASTSTPRVSSANERPEGVGAAMMTAKPTGETGLRPVDCGSARMPQSCSSLNATAMGSASTTGVYLQSFAQERHKISLTRERRAARTLAIIMGTFILCWLPFFLMYVILPLCGRPCRERMDNRAESFIVWLGYLNSAINPILYTTFNVDFRHAFQKLLPFNRCSLCCQRPG
ncbi:unnamed protein product [Protopolystoma xenopodis]|uniref:G-protein coupled receptors family 1 profile domain-containing protein n=1 Tax=Protopolystoma xenopodis TaxID=117903 RepID=A0A448WT93_9PLAT|nr:unnamed protein product [Protopolystoma xenopodis]